MRQAFHALHEQGEWVDACTVDGQAGWLDSRQGSSPRYLLFAHYEAQFLNDLLTIRAAQLEVELSSRPNLDGLL